MEITKSSHGNIKKGFQNDKMIVKMVCELSQERGQRNSYHSFRLYNITIVQSGALTQKEKVGYDFECLCSEPPPGSQHPVKFSGHKSCKSEDIIFWLCYETSGCSGD